VPEHRPSAVGILDYLDGNCTLLKSAQWDSKQIVVDHETIRIINHYLSGNGYRIWRTSWTLPKEKILQIEKIINIVGNLHKFGSKVAYDLRSESIMGGKEMLIKTQRNF
jgi:hypothetical protein